MDGMERKWKLLLLGFRVLGFENGKGMGTSMLENQMGNNMDHETDTWDRLCLQDKSSISAPRSL